MGGNRTVGFINLFWHFREHFESEESLCLSSKRTQIAIKVDFGCEEGWTTLFIVNCISLVANNSSSHGSNVSIVNVLKCATALRHPQLRRQFKQEKNNRNVRRLTLRWPLLRLCPPWSKLFLGRGPCYMDPCCLKMHLSPVRCMAIFAC